MSCIYGTRQFGFEDQGWIAWFMIAALTGKPIHIYGNGKQVRDTLYVKDLISAIRCFYHSTIKQGVWNIGGGPKHTLSLLELIHSIETLLGRKLKLRCFDWRPMDQRVYITDFSKLNRQFRWRPQYSVQRGVKILFDWIKENKQLFQ
jgi:CDP-paratose 2-epimerase